MQAVILAGGKGTRLHPYTKSIPKPLLPVGDYPIIEIIVRQLRFHGFKSIIFAVGHMSHLFKTFFEDNKSFNDLNLYFSMEENPLGTAGVLSKCVKLLHENFLLINGDILTTLNYENFMKHHLKEKNDLTIAVHKRIVDIDFGVLEFDKQNNLTKYIEKPKYHYEVSMGINMFQKNSIINYLKPNQYLDMPDLITLMLKDKKSISRYMEDCEWLDIGRPDDYEKASKLFTKEKSKYLNDKI